MTENTINQLQVDDSQIQDDNIRNEVIVTLDGKDLVTPMDSLELTMDSTPKEVLEAVAGMIQESEGTQDGYQDAYGDYTYTVRKAMNSNTIYVYPKPVAGMEADALNEYTDGKRLAVYNMLSAACTHLYSKGKLQEDKFIAVAKIFAELTVNDPVFMAHFTAYAANQDSKDLKVLAVFFNSLNDANGLPFFEGAKQCKPNYREVSYAILQDLNPHLALRVLELAHKKMGVDGVLNNSRHFSTGLKTAFKKYIAFRESNPESLRSMKQKGLSKKMKQMYRLTRTHPSVEAASILRWKQKFGGPDILESLPDFSSMKSNDIANTLSELKLSPTVALSVIPQEKITTKVAKALLEKCTGNQSIILYNWFAKNGFLDVKSINDLFKKKVSSATTAVDRIETLTKSADEEDKKEMAKVRSKVRKRTAKEAKLGKIFLHIDSSGSMQSAIQFAMDNAATIAECVDEPNVNFGWGLFSNSGRKLALPKEFTKEDFYKSLYGARAGGCTDCLALYKDAREMGAEVDVYITDQGHNVGDNFNSLKVLAISL